jgi:uncharacterized DUF497 family protein
MEFDWDPHKALHNLRKHGVTFQEAATIFADIFAITYPDPDHSRDEDRFITIGLSKQNRLLIIAHAEREGLTRLISAREVTRTERKLYENKS